MSFHASKETGDYRLVFEAIRGLVANRMNEITGSYATIEGDDDVADAVTELRSASGSSDDLPALLELVAKVRRDELRELATRIEVLGFESFGQALVLPGRARVEVP